MKPFRALLIFHDTFSNDKSFVVGENYFEMLQRLFVNIYYVTPNNTVLINPKDSERIDKPAFISILEQPTRTHLIKNNKIIQTFIKNQFNHFMQKVSKQYNKFYLSRKYQLLSTAISRNIIDQLPEEIDFIFTPSNNLLNIFTSYKLAYKLNKPLNIFIKSQNHLLSSIEQHIFTRAIAPKLNMPFCQFMSTNEIENIAILNKINKKTEVIYPGFHIKIIANKITNAQNYFDILFIGEVNHYNYKMLHTIADTLKKIKIKMRLNILTSSDKYKNIDLAMKPNVMWFNFGNDTQSIEIINKSGCILIGTSFDNNKVDALIDQNLIYTLVSKKPIIAVVPKNCFLYKFLESYNAAFILDSLKEEHLLEALAKVYSDHYYIEEIIRNAGQAAHAFNIDQTTEDLALVLSKQITEISKKMQIKQHDIEVIEQ